MEGELAGRIAALSSDQRRLLERRLAEKKQVATASGIPPREIQRSLFFFSSDGDMQGPDKYRLLLECARFAERHGFAAVWTPERHFKNFGGLFPSPSILAAALAMVTSRIQLRAGSVVLPLQDPLRVAEEWSVADNLSGGRVAVAFASGWHPDDFVLAPERYIERRESMYDGIRTVRRLWAGEAIDRPNGSARTVKVRIFPSPIQKQLPIWLTALSEETFVRAGALGANILTGLMEYDIDQCAARISRYRAARAKNGYDPATGVVTIMVHTYLGHDLESVKRQVRTPMKNYLRSFLKMNEEDLLSGPEFAPLDAADHDALLEHAFERYFETRSLLGTPQSCQHTLARLIAAGADEVACLLDFGLDTESVLRGLQSLNEAWEISRAWAAKPALAGG